MNLINKFDLKRIIRNDLSLGEKLFLIGIFFLPSALPVGGFFLLSSIVIALSKNNENLIKNKWNFIFLISIFFILLSTIYNYFFNLSPVLQNIDKSIILLNLFNWIPIYFAYLGFQFYLNGKKRHEFSGANQRGLQQATEQLAVEAKEKGVYVYYCTSVDPHIQYAVIIS